MFQNKDFLQAEENADAFIQFIISHRNLNEIDIKDFNLSDSLSLRILDQLSLLTNIRNLNLSGNTEKFQSFELFEKLCESIEKINHLSSLNLFG